MKKKNENGNYLFLKPSTLHAKWWFVLCLIILFLSFFYVNFIKDLIYQNVYTNIKELSEQVATQLYLSITEQKHFVQIMVDSINTTHFDNINEIFERFHENLSDYHFTRLVILDEKGNGMTSDGHIITNYQNIQEFFRTEDVYVSENRPSMVSDDQVNIYSKTFYLNGQPLVLMATINTEDYKEILLRRPFDKGGSYLINNDGSILIDSYYFIEENDVNLYEFIKTAYQPSHKKDSQKIDNMATSIKRQEVGTFDVQLGKDTYFVHYEKVNINDWYVVTIASDNTIAKELIFLVALSTLLCLLVNFIIIGICIYIDILNHRQNQRLYEAAYIDPVTLLGNENYFKEKGGIYLQKQKKDNYVVTFDIHKFNALNTIYGYDFCNILLRNLGEHLRKQLPSNAIICRISNDIFATIFQYEGISTIESMLHTIIQDTSFIIVKNTKVSINLSIGVYKIHAKDTDIHKVLTKAYMARSKVKGFYTKNYYIFDEILENELMQEQQIESNMQSALKNGEFTIVYQPKIYAHNEMLAGAEALVRWNQNGTIIPPNKFIPLFERNKFILKLDLYIFEQVCKDMASWIKNLSFVPTISINVSKEHFANENFIEEYVRIANKYHIDRKYIDLEITESATIDKNINILKILETIKKQGFIISIDDFGTGYSSLSLLQNMPIDIIKIDKTFVDNANLTSNKNIINYIMLIASHLGVKTIVEGVETKEQVEFVKNLKCDIIQGYYYSRPISKIEFENYMKKFQM